MSGIRTVAWKELREVYVSGGRRPVVGLIVSALFSILVAIFVPVALAFVFDVNHRWLYALVAGGAMSAMASFLGLFSPMATVVDTFAGERERHTLETLLASPLSDNAILGGKVLAQYVPVWGTALLLAVVSGVTATILVGPWGLLVFVIALGGLIGGSGAATLIISAGALISLSAPTVKKGQERLGYLMMPIFMLPGLSAVVIPQLIGRNTRDPTAFLSFLLIPMIVVPVVLLVVTVILVILLFTRFRRDRLISR